jgi:hypothetical protein
VAYQHASGRNRSVTEWSPASEAAAELLRLLAEVSELVFRGRGAGERAQLQADAFGRLDGAAHAAPAPVGGPVGGELWSSPTLGLLALDTASPWPLA